MQQKMESRKKRTIQETNRILVEKMQAFLSQPKDFQEEHKSVLYSIKAKLFELNYGLLGKEVLRYSERGIHIDELFQDARVALYLSPSRPNNEISQYSTYATHCVRHRMKDAFFRARDYKRGIHLPEQKVRKQRLIDRITIDLGNQYGRKPTNEEILDHYNNVVFPGDKKRQISFSELSFLRDSIANSKEVKPGLDAEESEEPIYSKEPLYSDYEKRMLTEFLNNGVLDDKERYIINSFFGLNGYKKRTLKSIGEEWGLTRERIRQIKEKGIKKLKRKMFVLKRN